LEYHKAKRRTKLLQIENALNGSTENVFLSLGINVGNVAAMTQFNNYTQQKARNGIN